MEEEFETCNETQEYFDAIYDLVDSIVEQIDECSKGATQEVQQLLQALKTNVMAWQKNELDDAYTAFESLSEWFPDPDEDPAYDAAWDEGWESYSRDDS